MTIQTRLDTSSSENIEEKFGFILMLDALGVRNFKHTEQWNWLHNRDLMLRHLAEQQIWHMNRLECERAKAIEQIAIRGLPPESLQDIDEMIAIYQELHDHSDFSSFGDTVIFHLWCSDRYETPKHSIALMGAIALSLHEIMKANIKFNLKLRGSLTLGKYFLSTDGNSILGSALIEAHRFHEIADWIGILVAPGLAENRMNEIKDIAENACKTHSILTPEQLSQCTDLTYRELIALSLCGIMTKYEVPLSKGGTQIFWVPSWPLTIQFDRITSKALNALHPNDESIARQCMNPLIQESNTVDLEYRTKYENTIAFFNATWCVFKNYCIETGKF